MPIKTGTVLGRYRMLERAGTGGMSEVWKAEDETLKRTVAVKVILGPVAQDATFRERFLREARLVAGLEHPNVLPVYDYGSSTVDGEDVSYLVMPLVAGGSLKGRVAGPVPPALAVSWLAAIASALDHAHAKGILHRDIKPANVLMDSQGRPLLADFGLARSTDATSGLTATGTVMGTPLYMAPEQATGGALDGRADEYALAVVAFELLSGRVPFIADSPLAVLHQQVTAPPPPLSTVLPGSPAGADAVLGKALAKKAEERYASCGAFVRALGEALGVPSAAATVPQAASAGGESQLRTVATNDFGAPPLAAPASAPVPGVDTSGRTKWALAAILLLSAGGGAWLLLRGTGRPGASSEADAKPTPGISLSNKETPAAAAATASTDAGAPSTVEISDSSKVNEASSASTGTAGPAVEPTPHSPFKEKSERPTPASRIAGNTTRPDAAPVRPRQTAFPPLLSGAGFSGDTQLSAAWEALDTHGRSRLTREDFVNAMGAAREVLARRPTAEVRFLDQYARAGVAYADGRNAEAWQLLTMALRDSGPAADTRVMRFVADEVHAMGPNPGPDSEWVMGLAFGDARGELREELDKAQARAPRSPRVQEARVISGR
ncbi:MAG TPA: serine/threonine-protein kinase [Thermoanaerobaculia bacterium]|nr:serine/threonine-protein kinase [Thermoanaerobaculia bacterium]